MREKLEALAAKLDEVRQHIGSAISAFSGEEIAEGEDPKHDTPSSEITEKEPEETGIPGKRKKPKLKGEMF